MRLTVGLWLYFFLFVSTKVCTESKRDTVRTHYCTYLLVMHFFHVQGWPLTLPGKVRKHTAMLAKFTDLKSPLFMKDVSVVSTFNLSGHVFRKIEILIEIRFSYTLNEFNQINKLLISILLPFNSATVLHYSPITLGWPVTEHWWLQNITSLYRQILVSSEAILLKSGVFCFQLI